VPVRAQSLSRAALMLAAIVAADQLTKAIVRSSVALGEENAVFPGVQVVHVLNRGVAFGALSGQPIVIVVVLLALAGLVAWFAVHSARPYVWLPTGMLLGGAIGNLVDRVRDGAVTDWIKIPLWPAFNLADVFIVVGVATLFGALAGGDRRKRPSRVGQSPFSRS